MKNTAVFFSLFFSISTLAQTPEWVKQMSQSQTGSIFTSVCQGEGPSVDLARMEAVRHCKASAGEQLGSKMQVQSLAVRSDSTAGFHQEISQSGSYEGISCTPKETFSQSTNGHFTFWIKCEFDLSKAKFVKDDSDALAPAKAKSAEDRVASLSSSSRDVKKLKSTAAYDQSENKTLSVISIPACDDMMIRGPKARMVKCHDNPNDVAIGAQDTDILVRRAGYASKTINLTDLKAVDLTTVTVVMDPL
jgi:hypothetical protein